MPSVCRSFERCSLIFVVSNQTEQELLCLTNTSPVDLLCEPVPSCLPSPQLRPDPVVLESADLIQFEERPAPLPGKSLLPSVVFLIDENSHSLEDKASNKWLTV